MSDNEFMTYLNILLSIAFVAWVITKHILVLIDDSKGRIVSSIHRASSPACEACGSPRVKNYCAACGARHGLKMD